MYQEGQHAIGGIGLLSCLALNSSGDYYIMWNNMKFRRWPLIWGVTFGPYKCTCIKYHNSGVHQSRGGVPIIIIFNFHSGPSMQTFNVNCKSKKTRSPAVAEGPREHAVS